MDLDSKAAPVSAKSNTSFDELLLEKVKGPSDKPPQKRRKIDLMAKVITHETLLQDNRK